ncbi:DUF4132 domain-containing protein [Haloferula sp. BvORR071]|uniref:DUF4132 domain-containing protein n=1 Tax=Haloferula sp. BvORR071 TaxID=1396141 RepID=UPI00054EBEAB|nr:DUF4132 domain-containing protein [Haloferula sp. BvORR071]
MHPELEDFIKRRMPAAPGPVDRAYLAAFEDYAADPGGGVLGRLPQGPGESKLVPELGGFMAHRFPDDLGMPALPALAAHSLMMGWYQSPLVTGYFEALLDLAMKQPELQEPLLAFSRTHGVPDGNLAQLIVAKVGYRFEFGWTSESVAGKATLRTRRKWGDLWVPYRHSALPPAALITESSFERFVMELDDAALSAVAMTKARTNWGTIGQAPKLLAAIAAHRPEALKPWVEASLRGECGLKGEEWKYVLCVTDRWDREFVEVSPKLPVGPRLKALAYLETLRPGKASEAAREAALDPEQDCLGEAMAYLAEYFPADFFAAFTTLLRGEPKFTELRYWGNGVSDAFKVAAQRWNEGGKALYQALLDCSASCADAEKAGKLGGFPFMLATYAVPCLLAASSVATPDEVRAWAQSVLQSLDKAKLSASQRTQLCDDIWSELIECDRGRFFEPLVRLLGDDRKQLRGLAIEGLRHYPAEAVLAAVEGTLKSGKTKQRLGVAEMLAELPAIGSPQLLESALADEKNEEARATLHQGLKARSGGSPVSGETLANLELSFAKQASKLKLPTTSWLKADTLPPLFATDGSSLSANAIAFLLSKQSKHKAIEAAPDILPLLAHIDRTKSASFGLALVEGFLNSEQAATDRWALALGGFLGDNRVIPPLLSRINDWCENSRHKLAEYSAQAISLLPGNEPLMVLDTLANRYRSKFKNVGKACADAFSAAATARGITPDELGDMVVPDFGFDAEGIRLFEWEGGKANAELGPDFKLSWSDPDSDKSWKALPASASESVKTELKTLTKLLKEAVKGQTARLEMTLVRQRRWPVARWRELYENHPLLRSFASSLVWGIYDTSGTLLRSFRRYPNGLLANAAGDLEELPEADTQIGMVHPLELDAAALDAWRAHLARFKVKQPFPQIDRPVELLDPLHGNRREMTLTSDKKVGAGTFKSRSEKRGWFRGSVIDAGGISSIYKPFPGAGYEAILPTNNYYMGIDPMDNVELESACFVKTGSIDRGSYAYDEPNKDDPRVLRFDQVPAVVFSETMSDLKAIIGA